MAADNQITTLPTPPNRGMDSATFTATADAFLGALPTFGTEINAVTDEVNENADSAAFSALLATTQADLAASATGALPFNPATNYTQLQPAISLLDGQAYRRKTAGISSTDPKLDGTNWYLSIDYLTRAQSIAVSLYF